MYMKHTTLLYAIKDCTIIIRELYYSNNKVRVDQ